ncbi:MAG: Gfo/Idh/MocA family oxidoreductase [Proteobacteria bacterium]|nr:Gfo/Idh/MocA family oxidoreductase [Pseudomonadota bacterium]
MKTKSKIIFGLIGVGNHAQEVIRTFPSTEYAELELLLTSSKEKVDALRSSFPDLDITSQKDDLYKHPQLSAVFITSPNSLHYQQTKECLLNHKHVISEKPLCLKASEARELNHLAKERSLVLAENFAYRFHPQHLKVKELLLKNVIGEPLDFKAFFHYNLQDKDNIRMQEKYNGGALSDAGCYLLDTTQYLFNEKIKSINSNSEFHPEKNIDLETTISLVLSSGLKAELSCSMKRTRANSYVIKGTKGQITVNNAYHVKANQKVSIEVENLSGEKEIIEFLGFNQLSALIDAFSRKISDSSLNFEELTDGIANAELLEQIIRKQRYLEFSGMG